MWWFVSVTVCIYGINLSAFWAPGCFTHFFYYQIYHLPLSNTTVSSCTHFLLYAFFVPLTCLQPCYNKLSQYFPQRCAVKLTGTKLGCAEGGCGACTVMISKYERTSRKVVYPFNIHFYLYLLLFYCIWLLTTTNYWAVKYILYKRKHLFQLLYGLVVILWNLYSTGSRVQFV